MFNLHLEMVFNNKTGQVCLVMLKGDRDVGFCAKLYSLPVFDLNGNMRSIISITDLTGEIQAIDELIQLKAYADYQIRSPLDTIISENTNRNIDTFDTAIEKV